MADTAASIAAAKKAGYSDAEIAAFMSKDATLAPKVKAARSAGYSDEEIVGHLGKVNAVADFGKSLATGVGQAVTGVVGMVGDLQDLQGNLAEKGFQAVGRKLNLFTPEQIAAQDKAPAWSNAYSASNGMATSGQVNRMVGLTYEPQTTAGKYARTTGNMAANALAPGGIVRKAASVLVPGVASEGAGQAVEAVGGGPVAATVARAVGGVAGGVTTGAARVAPRGASPVRNLPRQDTAKVAQRVQEYRAAGIQPTLVDVVDDSGRGAARAAASRMTPGRQAATDFADTRALNLPSRMGKQARVALSQDPRTPDQIRGAMVAQRRANADRNFGAVRGTSMTMPDETVLALRTDAARDAIREAARRERDPDTRRQLLGLADAAVDAPSTPITVGMADRVSRVLLSRAEAAARAGDNDLALTLGDLGRDIRSPAAQAVPGYRAALDDYGADSGLIEAAGVGEGLLNRNTDEFVDLARGLTDEERQVALAAARRAIERKAGENTASAPGVARQIANAPEQQARTAALAGPAAAEQLQTGMRLEERLVRNANDIAPRFGSQTQNKGADAAQMAEGLARGIGQAARQDWLGMGIDWLRSRGMNDQQAEALVGLATDPAQLDHVVRLITTRYGQQQAQQFLAMRQAALIGASSGAAASRQEQP